MILNTFTLTMVVVSIAVVTIDTVSCIFYFFFVIRFIKDAMWEGSEKGPLVHNLQCSSHFSNCIVGFFLSLLARPNNFYFPPLLSLHPPRLCSPSVHFFSLSSIHCAAHFVKFFSFEEVKSFSSTSPTTLLHVFQSVCHVLATPDPFLCRFCPH